MKDRQRHQPDYCLQASLEQTDDDESRKTIEAFSLHCGLHQLKRKTQCDCDTSYCSGPYPMAAYPKFHVGCRLGQNFSPCPCRPRLRWTDGMLEALRTLGCRNWRTIAQGRDKWPNHYLGRSGPTLSCSTNVDDDDDDDDGTI